MSPTEALGAFTENLDRRFRDFDTAFQSKMTDAMKWEDKTLQQYIDKNRLLEWVPTTFQAAQVEVKNEIDEATEAKSAAEGVSLSRSMFEAGGTHGVTNASLFGQS